MSASMPTCVHRVYSDPDRDSYTYGVSCGKDAVAYSIHPVTGEKMFWCSTHAPEHLESTLKIVEDNGVHGFIVESAQNRKARLETELRIAEDAFEYAIDRDAPDETVRRLERVRDEAARRLQMIGRGVRK